MKGLQHNLLAAPLIGFAWVFPSIVSAQGASFDISHSIGLFNIFVGLMLTAAFLLYGGGLITYFVRWGTVHRGQGIRIMEKGVTVLFVLVVLVALVQFFQSHPAYATLLFSGIITVIIVVLIFIMIAQGGTKSQGAKKKEE